MNIAKILLLVVILVAAALGIKHLSTRNQDNLDEGTWFEVGPA